MQVVVSTACIICNSYMGSYGRCFNYTQICGILYTVFYYKEHSGYHYEGYNVYKTEHLQF